MVELVIKNPDGSVYWKSVFNTAEEANKWLSEEETRSYWKADFVSTITDLTPPKAVLDKQADDAKSFRDASVKMSDDLSAILKAGVSASNVNQAVTLLIKKLVGG